MKVSKKPVETIKDGTPFLLRFVEDDLHYMKLLGNSKRAVYSVYNHKIEKLIGFASTEDANAYKHVKSLKDIDLTLFV